MEGLDVAYSIQQNLIHNAEITVWSQGIFELSITTIESLVFAFETFDFAVFVFSPDDLTKMRNQEHITVRDNVIFELGMSIGKLGRSRSFIIMPDKPAFHLPTDLLGITIGKYETSRSDDSLVAATGAVCHDIRKQIKKLGYLHTPTLNSPTEVEVSSKTTVVKDNKDDWFKYYIERNYDKALELIIIEIDKTTDIDQIEDLNFWKLNVEYKKDPVKVKKEIDINLENDKYSVEDFAKISRIVLWEDDLAFSQKLIDKGLEKFQNNVVLLLRKSEYFEKIGELDNAVSLIKSVDYLSDERIALKLASLYEEYEIKRSVDAFDVIKQAYLNCPTSKELMFKLGRLSQEVENKVLALYIFDKLTIKYPTNHDYWAYLGNACVDLELYNKALVAYKKGDELGESKKSWILSNIGNVLKNQGLYSEAKIIFKQALEINPNSDYVLSRLSSIVKLEEEETEKYNRFTKEGIASLNKETVPF